MTRREPPSREPSPGPLWRILRNQKVAFLIVGGLNTLIGFAAFTGIYYLWGDVTGYMGALVAAYALAILVAFNLQRRFVFRVRGQVFKDLARFTSVQLTSLALNAALLPLAVEVLHLPAVPAQALAIALVVVLSYFAHLSFSFRRHHPEAERTPESVEG